MQSTKTIIEPNSSFFISSSKLYLCLLVLYFCLPNYEFSALSASASGLKTSDFITVLIGSILLYEGNFKVNKLLLIFSLWYLFKGLASLSLIGFLFGARFLEYMIVIAAAYNLSKEDIVSFFNIFTKFLFFYFVIEFFFIIFGFSSPFSFFNSGQTWQGRFSLIFGGPYELGAIALMLLFLPGNNKKIFYIILLFSSQARASIIGLSSFFLNIKSWIYLFPILLLTIFAFANRFDDLFQLFPQITNIYNVFLNLISDFSYSSKEEYIDLWSSREDVVSIISQDVARSSLLRIYTYLLIFAGMSDFSTILFGYHPGIYGVAVDSSIIRIFGETGMIGLILFFISLKNELMDRRTLIITLAFLINLSLVDIYFSSKAFTLYWILTHYLKTYKQDEANL